MTKYLLLLLLFACGTKNETKVDQTKIDNLNLQADYYKKSAEYQEKAALYYKFDRKASDSLLKIGEYFKFQGDSMAKITSEYQP